MNPITFETLIADQIERIERKKTNKVNSIFLFIEDINKELKTN